MLYGVSHAWRVGYHPIRRGLQLCHHIAILEMLYKAKTQHLTQAANFKEVKMLETILLILLILFILGALPFWPHSRRWGYFPSGGLTILLIILIIVLLL